MHIGSVRSHAAANDIIGRRESADVDKKTKEKTDASPVQAATALGATAHTAVAAENLRAATAAAVLTGREAHKLVPKHTLDIKM